MTLLHMRSSTTDTLASTKVIAKYALESSATPQCDSGWFCMVRFSEEGDGLSLHAKIIIKVSKKKA